MKAESEWEKVERENRKFVMSFHSSFFCIIENGTETTNHPKKKFLLFNKKNLSFYSQKNFILKIYSVCLIFRIKV